MSIEPTARVRLAKGVLMQKVDDDAILLNLNTENRLNDVTNSIDLPRTFCSVSVVMRRLLVEILIIAAVIAFGWNKPFKDWVDQAGRNFTYAWDSIAR